LICWLIALDEARSGIPVKVNEPTNMAKTFLKANTSSGTAAWILVAAVGGVMYALWLPVWKRLKLWYDAAHP
jgi:hypothetical protein